MTILRALLLALAASLTPTRALADVSPPKEKPMRNTILIEGEIPKGKTLLLGSTTPAPTPLQPAEPAPIRWEPKLGMLRLVLVDAAEVHANEAGAPELEAIVERGIACAPPFRGVRTMLETTAATEVRFVYRLQATPTSCSAAFVRTDYLAGSRVLGPARGAPAPEVAAAATTAPPPASAAPTERAGCTRCSAHPVQGADASSSDARWAAWSMLPALLACARRKRTARGATSA